MFEELNILLKFLVDDDPLRVYLYGYTREGREPRRGGAGGGG